MSIEGRSDVARGTTRRELLAQAGVAAAMLAAPGVARAGARGRRPAPTVAIFGGGMGGLSAAFELAERGFDVTVYEPRTLGGKARSIQTPFTGTGGRGPLPGEHGFRFFPGYYQAVPDTMSRIPAAGGGSVFDNLVNGEEELLIVNTNQELWGIPVGDSLESELEWIQDAITALGLLAKVPIDELGYAVNRILIYMTSCQDRRDNQWENIVWYDYVNAANFTKEYQVLFGNGLTKDLVAAKGTLASTNTIGLQGEAFLYCFAHQYYGYGNTERPPIPYGDADRLLDGPTSDVWITPWVTYLAQRCGVKFVMGSGASKLNVRNGEIANVVVTNSQTGRGEVVTADYYIAAMPVDRAVPLFQGAVFEADPALAGIADLTTDYMNGIQFFLNQPLGQQVKGHIALLESPWSVTGIDQGLFWKNDIAETYGDGSVVDILSIDISDWHTPGILYDQPAVECTEEQIYNEVLAQMMQGLNAPGRTVLTEGMVEHYFLDPDIVFSSTGPAVSLEPLLVNTAGSLADRPSATTGIPNLFLAADYVNVPINLATMEGANQAGRLACAGILEASGSTATPPVVARLWQPPEFSEPGGWFEIDQQRWNQGLPNQFDTSGAGSQGIGSA